MMMYFLFFMFVFSQQDSQYLILLNSKKESETCIFTAASSEFKNVVNLYYRGDFSHIVGTTIVYYMLYRHVNGSP